MIKNPILHPEVITSKDESKTETQYFICLSSKTFKVGQIEYEILQLIDGRHSPKDIQDEFLKKKDIEIPIQTIENYIDELTSLGIISFDERIKRKKSLRINMPRFIYKGLSFIYNPVLFFMIIIFNIICTVLLVIDIKSINYFLLPYYSFQFCLYFIIFFLLTSFLHEVGHGAAIIYFNYKPGPIQIKYINGFSLFHFSLLFINQNPQNILTRKRKIIITSGGIFIDWIIISVGFFLFKVLNNPVLKLCAILLSLASFSRIILVANFFNKNSDLAKIINFYFEPKVSFKKHIFYKITGTIFWILHYCIPFYLFYVLIYPFRLKFK